MFGIDHLTLVPFKYDILNKIFSLLIRLCLILLLQQTTEDNVPTSINEALETRRRAVYNAVVAYVAANYKPEESGVSVFATADNKIVIVISSEKPNLRNFWSGRWTSAWTVANNKIAGNVKVCMIQYRKWC